MNVPKLMVKLVAATTAEISGRAVVIPVLQVTPRRVPVVVSLRPSMKISLLAVTADVLTTHVPVEALVAHENEPAIDAEQETTLGLAAVPTAPQFEPVASVLKLETPLPLRLSPIGALSLTKAASVPLIRKLSACEPS